MLVLCNECHRHYDDTAQSPDCKSGYSNSLYGIHRDIGPRPIDDHLAAVRAYAPGARWSPGTVPRTVGKHVSGTSTPPKQKQR